MTRRLECVQRNLTRDFQNCLSGIRGVKYQRDAAPQDLRDLQDINDGLHVCGSIFLIL